MSRTELLRRGAAGGAVLVASGTGLAALAAPAAAAGVPDGDLSYLRLLVAAELLKADFEAESLASRKLTAKAAALMRRMQAYDRAHYGGLAVLMKGAGQIPATAEDIDFSYPRGSFASAESITTLGSKLVTLALGAYLGAVENVQTPALRLPLGQIAANEAQQLSALAHQAGRPMIRAAFASAFPIGAVSDALDEFES